MTTTATMIEHDDVKTRMKRRRRPRHIDHLSFTSTHSVDPISPYSSAPHEQNMMVLRGFHSPREREREGGGGNNTG